MSRREPLVVRIVEHGSPDDPWVARERERLRGTNRLVAGESEWDLAHPLNVLLKPYGTARFLKQKFRKSHIHLKANDRSRLEGYFSVQELLDLLSWCPIPSSQIEVFDSAGKPEDLSRMGLGDPSQGFPSQLVLRVQGAKGSLILKSLQALHPAAARLAKGFTDWTGFGIRVNAYFTPGPGRQTFPWHWDNHDVFIMQVEGSKYWRIFEPKVERPLHHHNHPMWRSFVESSSKQVAGIELQKGDILYIPAGFPHFARTRGPDSLHLTIGLYQVSHHEVVRGLFERALLRCEQDLAFRFPAMGAPSLGTVERLAKRVLESVDPGEAREVWELEMLKHRDPGGRSSATGIWRSLQGEALKIESGTFRRTDIPCFLARSGEHAALFLREQKLLFPAATYSLLSAIVELGQFKLSELPRVATGYDAGEIVKALLSLGILIREV